MRWTEAITDEQGETWLADMESHADWTVCPDCLAIGLYPVDQGWKCTLCTSPRTGENAIGAYTALTGSGAEHPGTLATSLWREAQNATMARKPRRRT